MLLYEYVAQFDLQSLLVPYEYKSTILNSHILTVFSAGQLVNDLFVFFKFVILKSGAQLQLHNCTRTGHSKLKLTGSRVQEHTCNARRVCTL